MTNKRMSKGLKKVMNSFPLFAKNFIKIVDNNGEIISFLLNPEQEQFYNTMEKYNIILKGRQIGFTTFSMAYMLYCALTIPNTSYLIMTHHNKITQSLLRKFNKMYQMLPHDKYGYLFPKKELDNRDEIYFSNGSRIQVATANGNDSISGNTFHLIHLSEMAKYPEQEQGEIIATAIPALAKNPHSKIIIESTAMGYNTYQEMFHKAYKGKETVWKAHFYSWLAEAYSKQFKHTFDEAEKWYKLHNQGKRLTYSELEPDEMLLKDKYNANYRQLMYRRYYIESNSIDKFMREFPTTPDEAFQTSNVSVFDTNRIVESLHNAIDPIPTKEIYNDLPDELQEHINKNLFIFHAPKRGVRHYAGADVASGGGNNTDNSTMTVFDSDGKQVASFYANDVPVYLFAKIVNGIGRYFNYAFITVERNSYGLPLLERLRQDYNYLNLYKQRVFDQKGRRKKQLGFMTSSSNKAILINDLKEQFELRFINVNCKETLEEMKIFQDVNGKMGNKKGDKNHDDLVISLAMSVQAMKENKYFVDI